jgi:hypothetical protein
MHDDLIRELRHYARSETTAATRDGEQMHLTIAGVMSEAADALEASSSAAPDRSE